MFEEEEVYSVQERSVQSCLFSPLFSLLVLRERQLGQLSHEEERSVVSECHLLAESLPGALRDGETPRRRHRLLRRVNQLRFQ